MLFPSPSLSTPSAHQPLEPDSWNLVGKVSNSSTVTRDSEVAHVSSHCLTQALVLIFHRQMTIFPAPLVQVRERTSQTIFRSLLDNYPVTIPRGRPQMRKSKKVESIQLPGLGLKTFQLCLLNPSRW